MFLTVLLYGQRRVPGYQWIGKYRKTKRVTYNQRLRQKYQAQHISRVCNMTTPTVNNNILFIDGGSPINPLFDS